MYSDDSIYVVFTKAKDLGWIRRLLHPEISHCFAMWPEKGHWIVYDHSLNHISIFTVDSVGAILAESIVIKVEADQTGYIFGLYPKVRYWEMRVLLSSKGESERSVVPPGMVLISWISGRAPTSPVYLDP